MGQDSSGPMLHAYTTLWFVHARIKESEKMLAESADERRVTRTYVWRRRVVRNFYFLLSRTQKLHDN
jgi:hypothetical protein